MSRRFWRIVAAVVCAVGLAGGLAQPQRAHAEGCILAPLPCIPGIGDPGGTGGGSG